MESSMTSGSALEAFYSFRPAARTDLPMLRRWLATPEVRRWWGADPDAEVAILEADLDETLLVMRIVSYRGRPFAYVQDYPVHAWPQPYFAELPPGSRGVDAFIGEPDMLGCGHGSAFLRLLAERLVAEGAPSIAITPDPGNVRARRAYRNAGFHEVGVVETDEGPSVLMVFRIPEG
jgi:aminoglycoside 6'-N-acetyltransferase